MHNLYATCTSEILESGVELKTRLPGLLQDPGGETRKAPAEARADPVGGLDYSTPRSLFRIPNAPSSSVMNISASAGSRTASATLPIVSACP